MEEDVKPHPKGPAPRKLSLRVLQIVLPPICSPSAAGSHSATCRRMSLNMGLMFGHGCEYKRHKGFCSETESNEHCTHADSAD
ncbi:mCG1040456 [Mus musculus]|nr:mCG1040456 [Mus musculus]